MRHSQVTRMWLFLPALAVVCASATVAVAQSVRAVESGSDAPWYFSPSLGVVDFEGDQEFKDGIILSARGGYDYSDRWSLEGIFSLAPSLDSNDVDGRFDPDWSNTYMLQLAFDGLFHFTRWDRLDPYLAAGIGFVHFGEDPEDGDQNTLLLRAGAGVFYHFNDEWAIRVDYRGMLAGFGDNPNANAVIDGGVVWTWGAAVPQDYRAVAGSSDSDGDGLSDADEAELGTDPYDPDTDKDRLTDGDEVNRYQTDPLNADTDWDSLKDGEEVFTHSTDPRNRDTDSGGVADGHEVIEDRTNPRDPADDLLLYELYIQFDYNDSVIKPRFTSQLDVIAKVLKRHPNSTARVEGHADRTRKSGEAYNKRLSRQRADAVVDALVGEGIARERLQAVGYGFSRPKAPNDPVSGNPLNRRVEVYISGTGDAAVDRGSAAAIAPLPADK